MAALTPAQTDRAVGVLLAAACGDALGAGYEFGTARLDGEPRMIGGGLGNFAPGEWTDDTSQAVAIAEVAATGADLRSDDALTAVARRFADWYAGGPADVGIQTAAVLRRAGRTPTGAEMAAAAYKIHRQTGKSAGNGSLMRTGAVALAHLDDPEALVEAAMAASALTHHDPLAGQGCALWCLMIRHAVLHGELPKPDEVLGHLPHPDLWAVVLDEATSEPPSTFQQNGWVVGALQAAWSAVVQTPVPANQPWRHLRDALNTAVGIGNDTDTVAAIAGALLGARWGASAVPAEWRRMLHGWPGMRGPRLVALAHLTIGGGRPDSSGWPGVGRLEYDGFFGRQTLVPHPHDDGVWIGGVAALDDLPAEVDAVVSLCRVGAEQVPDGVEHVEFRLIDKGDDHNPHVDFVIDDAARTVQAMRAEGRTVYLHCVAAQSRTPTVATRYAALLGVPFEQALAEVVAALPAASPNPSFRRALGRLHQT
ncbi:ADP-ribosylglycohydrolase family protein [Nocardioides sp. GCM10027113]|uniref:ADP-ribosylglycohydrolase family protein n=1 Tax=unclassified Nocardioides TaxID=2615069 RepID=UPI0036224EA2